MLKMQEGPTPLTNLNSLRESNKNILAADPSAMADTSASGAEVAMDVCRLDAHRTRLSEPSLDSPDTDIRSGTGCQPHKLSDIFLAP